MQKLICFDLDNTLLDHSNFKIPDSAMRAVSLLKEKGHIVVIATGRDMDNYYSRKYLELIGPRARIDQNGARVIADGEVLTEHWIDKGLLRRMMDYAASHGVGLGCTINDEDYYVNPDRVREAETNRFGSCGRQFQDPELLLSLPIRTVAFIGTNQEAAAMEAAFPEVTLRVFSIDYGADVIENGFSKAEGLKTLCAHYQIPMSETLAFGDSMNDLEILKEAAVGIAMGNAREALKKAADYVTDHIAEDGIWNACVHFGLI